MEFKLYIAGDSEKNRQYQAQVRALMHHLSCVPDRLEICDVMSHPELAQMDGILATPTLRVRNASLERRIIGHFGDLDKTLACMEPLVSKEMEKTP